MSNIAKLVPKDAVENTSNKVLEESMTMGFETVVVFGLRDGKIHIKCSGTQNTIELIGHLEAAKMQLWSNA